MSDRDYFLVAISPVGEALLMFNEDYRPSVPRQVLLHEKDSRGVPVKTIPIRTWGDVIQAFNDWPWLLDAFDEGDIIQQFDNSQCQATLTNGMFARRGT